MAKKKVVPATKKKRSRSFENSPQRKLKASSKAKARGNKTSVAKELIVIDEKQGLIFDNEKTLFGYFMPFIQALEDEYQGIRSGQDFNDQEQQDLETYLESTLDDPDEVWFDNESFDGLSVYFMIKSFEETAGSFYYIAACYMSEEERIPTFVYFHFPTKIKETMENYRRVECQYHRKYESVQAGSIEGDSLVEGDPLAIGLYDSMRKIRSDKDILEEKFKDFANYREDTIQEPDEIWRKVDLEGNVLVTFIREIDDSVENLHYIVVTQEEEDSQVHSLLFSFPTVDTSLVDRYRQGENLQAEEVSQESSH